MSEDSMIKKEILQALKHPEAEDGLYFNNLIAVHEEEERTCVQGDDLQVLDALFELIQAGQIFTSQKDGNTVFHLSK
jgi:hypothetical protein